MKIAIVSTVKTFDSDFDFYVNHHASKGVTDFCFFLDRPEESKTIPAIIEICTKYHVNLVVRVRNEELESEWKKIPEYEKLAKDLDTLAVNRQVLNVYLAQEWAIKEKIDWLIHIDDDELMMPIGWGNLGDYLSFLPKEYNQVKVLTLEALYEKMEYSGKFTGINSFKKNPYSLLPIQLEKFKNKYKRNYYYLSHVHGKSILRISALLGKPKLSEGVHLFNVDYTYLFEANPYDLSMLHFPFSGVSGYKNKFNGINKKRVYQYESKSEGVNFYTESRIIVSEADDEKINQFYQNNAVFDSDMKESLMKDKMLVSLDLGFKR